MGDGMSLNNYGWMGFMPDTMRTMGSNNWSLDMFGSYPNDSLAAIYDTKNFKLDFNTSLFMDDTVRMNMYASPLIKMLEASIANYQQNSIFNLSSKTPSITFTDRRDKVEKKDDTKVEDRSKIDGMKEIDKEKVSSVIKGFVNDKYWGSGFNEKITYKNADGTEIKDKTLLQRLVGLCDDYMRNEKPELSTENYNTIWDIAGKYAKTGKLDRDEYLALKKIALNPGGSAADSTENTETKKEGKRPEKNKTAIEAAAAGAPDNYNSLASEYARAIYEANGTDIDKLYELKPKINENNILEVYNAFGNEGKAGRHNHSIVDAIFDDCDGWGNGYRDGWDNALGWNLITGPILNLVRHGEFEYRGCADDAKPHIEKLNEAFIKRTKAFAKNNPKIAKEYGFIVEEDGKDKLNIPETLIDKKERSKTSENFANLAKKLEEAEKEAYGEYTPEVIPATSTQG